MKSKQSKNSAVCTTLITFILATYFLKNLSGTVQENFEVSNYYEKEVLKTQNVVTYRSTSDVKPGNIVKGDATKYPGMEFLSFVNFSSYEHAERSFVIDRLPIYLERAQRVRNVCLSHRNEHHSKRGKMNLIWERDHVPNVVYCPLFKVASTTWISNFLLMARHAEGSLEEPLKLSHRFKAEFGWTHLTAYKIYKAPELPEERFRVLNNSVRFMVVRHPILRLLSLYKVKIERSNIHQQEFHYQRIIKEIIRSYRTTDSNNKTDVPTFKEFVQYVIDHTDQIMSIPALKPQWETCRVCRMDYNIIMQLETFSEDQQFLAILANYEEVKKTKIPPSIQHKMTSTTIAKKYYSQLNHSQINEIYRIYQPDFEMFNYKIEEF